MQQVPGGETLLAGPTPARAVGFHPGGRSSAAVVEELGQQGIWIRRLDDPDCLRACTHITTTEAEIDQLLEALTALS